MSSAADDRLIVAEPTLAPMQPLAVSVRVAGDLVNVSERTMSGLVSSGEIRSVLIGTRRLVPVDELRRWLAEKTK